MVIFSIKHVTIFFCLGTLDSTSGLHLGTILNSETTNKRHQNVKNVALIRPQKGHEFTTWELKQEGIALLDLSWECTLLAIQIFATLCAPLNDFKSATRGNSLVVLWMRVFTAAFLEVVKNTSQSKRQSTGTGQLIKIQPDDERKKEIHLYVRWYVVKIYSSVKGKKNRSRVV